MPAEKKPKSRIQQVANYSGLGIQTVGIIGVGAYLGHLLDEKFQTEKSWYTLAFIIAFMVISMYYTIKKLNKLNNE